MINIDIKEKIGFYIFVIGLIIYLLVISGIFALLSDGATTNPIKENIFISIQSIISYFSMIIIFIGSFLLAKNKAYLFNNKIKLMNRIIIIMLISIIYIGIYFTYLIFVINSNSYSVIDLLLNFINFYLTIFYIMCLFSFIYLISLRNKWLNDIGLYLRIFLFGGFFIGLFFRIIFLHSIVFCCLIICVIITYTNHSKEKSNQKET